MSINDYIGKFIQKEELLSTKTKVLLAVSGGVDSMVMLHLMSGSDTKIGVATINYKLRDESDQESKLVAKYCNQYDIPFHPYIVSEGEKSNLKSGNLQSKARDIRYNFFDTLMINYGYTHIMTAHHKDDKIEGFFLSLLRGAGLDGLTNLVESKGQLLRPFLKHNKSELLSFANTHSIPYMNDKSNFENDYDRNFVRNDVLPIIERRFAEYGNSISQSIDHLTDANALLQHLVNEKKNAYLSKDQRYIMLHHFSSIKTIPGAITFLHMIIKKYGFNSTQVRDMLSSEETGALFYTATYVAIIDRDRLIIRERKHELVEEATIDNFGNYTLSDGSILKIEEVKKAALNKSVHIEYFDLNKVSFPLTVRRWKSGDRFCPLGMNGRTKKVQDVLTDAKINRFEKEEVRVVMSADQIIWLVNYRMDERYKLPSVPSKILRIELVPNTEL